MAHQKTYWHLLQQRRMPTEYEIVTSKLLCYTGEGFTGKRFELDVPLMAWYKRFQQDSPLTCSSWENFRDPRETTYTKYTEIQRDKEIFVDGILEEIEMSRCPFFASMAACSFSRVCSFTISGTWAPDGGVLYRTDGSEWAHRHRRDAAGGRRNASRATTCVSSPATAKSL
jgi:hypothetical protein